MPITKLWLKQRRKSKMFNARATAKVAELLLHSLEQQQQFRSIETSDAGKTSNAGLFTEEDSVQACRAGGHEVEDQESTNQQQSVCTEIHRFISKGLNLSSGEINRLRRERTESLLQEKKLILILDLDHTLVHTVDAADLSEEEVYFLDLAENNPNRLGDTGMVTKPRPFVRDFLREASKMFDMYIYTMGCRDYALDIARLLDPQGVYFNSKVMSLEESTVPMQKGLDIVLGEERITLIVDDTESVWARDRKNLVLIERYRFFGSRNCDESELSGALATTLYLLGLVHRLFFDGHAFAADFSGSDVRELSPGHEDQRRSVNEYQWGFRSSMSLILRRMLSLCCEI